MNTTMKSRRQIIMGLTCLPLLGGCAASRAPSPSEGVPLHLGSEPEREVFARISETDVGEVAGVPAPKEISIDPQMEVNQILVYPDLMVIRFVYAPGRAREYSVGLGRAGLEFEGEAVIERKEEWPSWRPTDDMIARNPDHYGQFAGGVPGGPDNPLGARALYLYRDGVDTYYRIHGTDAPATIGTRVSNGCIRMLNEHVVDLYLRVPLGTRVKVMDPAGQEALA